MNRPSRTGGRTSRPSSNISRNVNRQAASHAQRTAGGVVDETALPADSLAAALQVASLVVGAVFEEGRSLTDALVVLTPPHQRGIVQDLAYTAVRQWGRTDLLLRHLTGGRSVQPPELKYLLTTALALACDPTRQRYEPHTLVDQAVAAANDQRATRPGKGLVNACLRRFFREQSELEALIATSDTARWGFPRWWIDRLKTQQPTQWSRILDAARLPPALTLRVNARKTTVNHFLAVCEEHGLPAEHIGDHAVWLPHPVPVHRIPGFMEGAVSVQDWAAQWAAPLLQPVDGMRVLDACCAPGGKTGHLLELADIELVALDVDPQRLERVADNLQRLELASDRVQLHVADAARLDDWWDGRPFDAILADVPCTGSGVTRRHPDIRWLRRPADVVAMSQLQSELLDVLWSVLRPGGTLLLVTCSIFGEEGEHLLARFRNQHPDAVILPSPGLVLPVAQPSGPGHDGFFYAKLQKGALTHA